MKRTHPAISPEFYFREPKPGAEFEEAKKQAGVSTEFEYLVRSFEDAKTRNDQAHLEIFVPRLKKAYESKITDLQIKLASSPPEDKKKLYSKLQKIKSNQADFLLTVDDPLAKQSNLNKQEKKQARNAKSDWGQAVRIYNELIKSDKAGFEYELERRGIKINELYEWLNNPDTSQKRFFKALKRIQKATKKRENKKDPNK